MAIEVRSVACIGSAYREQITMAESPVPFEEKRKGSRRETVVDRRTTGATGLERRRGVGRRRSDFVKAAEEGELTGEQFLFVMAINAYKQVNAAPYPSWTEVLEVIRKLGYRKTCAMQIRLDSCEDWTEAPDAPLEAQPPGVADADRDNDKAQSAA